MEKKDIINTYHRIKMIDPLISNEVLNFMKEAAIEKLNKVESLKDKNWQNMESFDIRN